MILVFELGLCLLGSKAKCQLFGLVENSWCACYGGRINWLLNSLGKQVGNIFIDLINLPLGIYPEEIILNTEM